MKRFQNQVAFITGGNSGIGLASALAIASEGAHVMIADLKSDPGIIKELEAHGIKAAFVKCDVSNPDEVKSAIDITIKTFGRLDIALNNAGIGDALPTHEKTIEQWQRVININLNGVFYCMKYQIEQMLKQPQGGKIINVASILGQIGDAGTAAYAAAKHGVVGLTKSAGIDYGTKNIRINAIGPAYIDTPLLKDLDKQTVEVLTSRHAMKRFGKAEEVAKVFLFLASEDSSFMTGDYIPVDGGYLAY